MIREVTLRYQTPNQPNEWLYREDAIGHRSFFHEAGLATGENELPECTNAERLAWQQAWDEAHQPQEERSES